ncbi:PopZ family protein [Phyllobacterium zundukense]|uniref:Pole-organizing protein PopZ n=1 Tax=Phyllobacterium zundukense TaxID=1867719 RepID=A0A2N9W1X5_9HYPH|nr:DUF2497 domain-containing protein [Phyllobacterium zundukense]ATU91487.1 hypothetical protein BLM14_07465 [Phyllobacterium zundukense]PIO45743.1 hypothetical protein B5P45_07070 [Phyllobacterium zundukense]
MAQSSSVAREPSMEEILASIRRIIEESDTGRPEDSLPQPVNSDVAPRPAAFEALPVEQHSEEELQPREGIAVSQAIPQSYETALGRPASSLQSKLVEREAAQAVPSPKAEDLTQPVTFVETSAAVLPASYAESDLEAFVAPEISPEPEPVAATPEQIVAEPVQPENEAEAAEPATVSPAPDTQQLDASVDDEVSLDLERALEPILSEATERQVSSAFEDLSFAVRNEQRRSFDEIAQEIMRPLLQDWLDNNLPTLVERLVREEIERVARGGRR